MATSPVLPKTNERLAQLVFECRSQSDELFQLLPDFSPQSSYELSKIAYNLLGISIALARINNNQRKHDEVDRCGRQTTKSPA